MTARRWRRTATLLSGGLILAGATMATMSWHEPPRYDGAGYATLGRALAAGQGYREMTRPDAPPHAHFPPGYPAGLALIWTAVGLEQDSRFTWWAHGASLVLMVVGLVAVGRWWLSTEPRSVALCLVLALAVNWSWARTGGVIRSEPAAIALGGFILLALRRADANPDRLGPVLGLGVGLGVAMLTRQVLVCWLGAVVLDLGWRRRGRDLVIILVLAGLILTPWLSWQSRIGTGSQSQLFRAVGLSGLVLNQCLFYARRIPDVVVGPFVEVATVFGRSRWLAALATVSALGASTLVMCGWVRLVRVPRTRIGGLIPLLTLPLLLTWPFTEAGRFLIPLLPFILMGGVEGGTLVLARVGIRRARAWTARLILLGSLPYAIHAIGSDRAGAERRTQADFDAACRFLQGQSLPAGPIMARHPGDVAWMTGRLAVPIPAAMPEQIDAALRRDHVAFLVVDEGRYALSPDNPLAQFARTSGRAALVWSKGSTSVYRIKQQE